MDNQTHSLDNGAVAQMAVAPATGYAPQPAQAARRGLSPVALLLGGFLLFGLCAIAAAGLWFVTGVGTIFNNLPSVTVGALQVVSTSVPRGSAESVAVNVTMGGGTLVLTGGASELLNADFSYNVAVWKPNVLYTETGNQGVLDIKQTDNEGFVRTPDNVRNDWNLRLKNGVPLTLTASLGAGISTIKLDGLSVSKLDLSTGAGETTVDLTGNWKQNLDANLNAGLGNTTIRLPKDVGVRVKVDGGLSNVNGGGLTRDGSYYTNSAYGKTPVTLDITVKSGIGNVKLQPEK